MPGPAAATRVIPSADCGAIRAAARLKSRRPLYNHSITRPKKPKSADAVRPDALAEQRAGKHRHNYPMGSATNFIASAVFTRISTACLPCDLASDSTLRTSFASLTALPPTSMMTSPDWKPCSAAEPSGSRPVTTIPRVRLWMGAGLRGTWEICKRQKKAPARGSGAEVREETPEGVVRHNSDLVSQAAEDH
jgi:hypothetical protein